ncbi:MAG: VanW family protein [Anaerolineales bacterium]|nr:VanW family protein [Anaerolineales bacterium]
MSFVTQPVTRQNVLVSQLGMSLVSGAVLFFLLVFAWMTGYQLLYAGRIFPGVSISGVDLSGLKPADAAVKLSQTLSYPYSGRVVLTDGHKLWITTPVELGMVFDASASAQAAFQLGRSGGLFDSLSNQVNALRQGVDVSPVIILDQRVAYNYLQSIASEIDQPVVEASLRIDDTQVVAQPGQIGRLLNVDATLFVLTSQLQSFHDGTIELVIEEKQPEILDVSEQEEVARRILSQPVTLTLAGEDTEDPGPWSFDEQTIAKMLTVQKVLENGQPRVQVTLDEFSLRQILSDIASQADRKAENARFIFNDETNQLEVFEAARVGRVVDQLASVTAINTALQQGKHVIPIMMVYDNPSVIETATGVELGITELVSVQTSYFYGSSPERIQNIDTARARFHGLLVAPGETFSMGEALGDISLDNGFEEALIIYGGRTIKGVGGGVCQVSTTLFRTVLFGGYPVDERHSHAYRVSYYEYNASGSRDPQLVGLDATVYFPLVDFKFTNDTPYWILMETYLDAAARTLTWKFYSTSDGRTVEISNTGPQNIVPPPPPLFEENPELEKNVIKQVDWAAEGADVVVDRTVYREGTVYIQDQFQTQYEPWRAVCEYGPATKDLEKTAKRKGACQP